MVTEQFNFLNEEWRESPDLTDIKHLYDIKLIGSSLEWYYYLWQMNDSFYLIRVDIETARNSSNLKTKENNNGKI